jgi:hypothetical protein
MTPWVSVAFSHSSPIRVTSSYQKQDESSKMNNIEFKLELLGISNTPILFYVGDGGSYRFFYKF